MSAYFRRINPGRGRPVLGRARLDRHATAGSERAAIPPASATNLSKRIYFRRVIATGKPYVSAGLIGRRLKQPIVVIAVPTRDARGRISGVLAGSILLETVKESKQALDLGYGGLQIVDRNGRLLLASLRPVANKALLGEIEQSGAGSGVLPRTSGIDGRGRRRGRLRDLQDPRLGDADRSPALDACSPRRSERSSSSWCRSGRACC